MAVTTYLRLQKPPFDTIPWDVAVNGNMDIIDSFVSQFMAVPNYTGMWANSTAYVAGQNASDPTDGHIYTVSISHMSATSPTTFAQDRVANPTYWTAYPVGATIYAPVISPAFTGNPTAPTPAGGDNDTSIATTAFVAPAFNNDGRNLLHNPVFRINQRGAGPFTAGYTSDRWLIQSVLDTTTYQVGTLGDAGRTAIGDEAATAYLANTFTGNAGATAYNHLAQRMEGVRRFAGKTVTVSFWANTSSGTPKLGINIFQFMGTGGSPSASVRALATGNSVTLSTTWTRYTSTIAIPTVIGKTLGSNGDDYTTLELWMSAGANNNANAGNIGVQSGTINFWGMQVEFGGIATQLEKPAYTAELATCQRFYQTGFAKLFGYTAAGASNGYRFALPTTMRTAPTLTPNFATQINCGSSSMAAADPTYIDVTTVGTGLGGFGLGALFTASAEP